MSRPIHAHDNRARRVLTLWPRRCMHCDHRAWGVTWAPRAPGDPRRLCLYHGDSLRATGLFTVDWAFQSLARGLLR